MSDLEFSGEKEYRDFKRRLPEELAPKQGPLVRFLLASRLVKSEKTASLVLSVIAIVLIAFTVWVISNVYPRPKNNWNIDPRTGQPIDGLTPLIQN